MYADAVLPVSERLAARARLDRPLTNAETGDKLPGTTWDTASYLRSNGKGDKVGNHKHGHGRDFTVEHKTSTATVIIVKGNHLK